MYTDTLPTESIPHPTSYTHTIRLYLERSRVNKNITTNTGKTSKEPGSITHEGGKKRMKRPVEPTHTKLFLRNYNIYHQREPYLLAIPYNTQDNTNIYSILIDIQHENG
jgi:hypothetical protein